MIDSKADRTELSNIIGETPLTPENFPDILTYTREELKKDLFIDMWDARTEIFGRYNKETGYFELNGLTDITYEEALTIYADSYSRSCGAQNLNFYNHSLVRSRTLFPIVFHGMTNSASWAFAYCYTLETVSLIDGYSRYPDNIQAAVKTIDGMFTSCVRLKKIIGQIIYMGNEKSPEFFRDCPALEEIDFKHKPGIDMTYRIGSCKKLSLDSLRRIVENKGDNDKTSATFVLHPSVYARLTDDLMADAAAKNIIFATTN